MTFNYIPEIVPIIGIPRAVVVDLPIGSTIGAPNQVAQQQVNLKQALQMIVDAPSAGQILVLKQI